MSLCSGCFQVVFFSIKSHSLFRRRVSNLLSSGFRQNLDQLIQSYVERQGHAAIDWDEASASPELTEDMEQTYQNEVQVNGVDSPHLALPPQPIPSSPLWHQESHHDNWPRHDMHQRFGIVSSHAGSWNSIQCMTHTHLVLGILSNLYLINAAFVCL